MTERAYARAFLDEVSAIASKVSAPDVEEMTARIAAVRDRGGRLFVLGVGGGAGHASHAVNDFRKLCGIESYAPTDNVSELTARTNDEGWETVFERWLRTSRLGSDDGLLIFSVGGGSTEPPVSANLVRAVEHAREVGATVTAVVGKPDGAAARLADAAIVIPAPAERLTPHVEAFQAVVWHLLVSHPLLASDQGRWETLAADPRG